jgi:hypothetical protein
LLKITAERDAVSAVSWLHRLFKVDRADLRMLALIHGLEAEQSVTLANGTRIMPMADAPNSPQSRMIFSRYQDMSWMMIHGNLVPPPAIAVFDIGCVEASTNHKTNKTIDENARSALLDAARAFTLSDRGAPVVGMSWIDYVDPELTLAEFGMLWMGARFEGSPSQCPVKMDDEALEWANRYLKTNEKLRRVLDLALDRLNLARRRHSPGDQAIDGGICLEALLGDEQGQEITFKLQLRAALLCGETLQRRVEIREAVKALYNLRSKVVHGRSRKNIDASSDRQSASRGLEICTQAVREIVNRGELPDFASLEITPGCSNAPCTWVVD